MSFRILELGDTSSRMSEAGAASFGILKLGKLVIFKHCASLPFQLDLA